MSRARFRIEDAAERFWKLAGGRTRYGRPVDLERATANALPLGIVKLPKLSTAKVSQVLARIGTVPWVISRDRPLRACLVADIGVGLVFVDGMDPPEEQRYSLAHEVAHFLLHYLEPRETLLTALGATAIEILDRVREPTVAERLSSAMAGLSLEPFRHAMSRNAEGTPSHFRTEDIESEADELAVELVAPASETLLLKDCSVRELAEEYGLPIWTGDAIASAPKDSDGGIISIFRKKNS